ncbi:hypothetical protein JOD45_001106 [Scopulibacillus daqui]|uniref:Uncharacterized protein n=1 Tax=Scopulibacillus daqui TaxID=1469162 RepID=A0ABS2PXZ2_9BACL|nr:hypothetical protein [Scopulibacillus daqui]MBM7644897.1 hypothetical protein [Scopulibacillus daqui]
MLKKEPENRESEIDYPDIREIEHKTPHPGPEKFKNLNDISYSPGENTDLNEHAQG